MPCRRRSPTVRKSPSQSRFWKTLSTRLRRDHVIGFLDAQAHRLVRDNVLSSTQGGHRLRGVEIIRRRQHNQFDVRVGQGFIQIGERAQVQSDST